MAEPDRGAEAVPEAAGDASKGSAERTGATGADFLARIRDSGRLGWLLLGLALVGAIVLVAAEFSTVSSRSIGIGACADRVGADKCRTTGHDAHAFALLILAVVGLVMAWGAVVGRSRAAAWASGLVGVGVLVIALAIDLPSLDDTRGLEQLYSNVQTHVGTGFRLELLGGVLMLLVGGLSVMRIGQEEERAQLAPVAEEAAAPPPPPPAEPQSVPQPGAAPQPDAAPEAEATPPEPAKPRTTARSKARQGRGKGSRARRYRRSDSS